ncbi:LLM class flavin-dependent oxidoreductase [Halolamina litorea]|uniref:Luciferase n=1 Tax=Halolamina litorea TaxID=1515593 RepID=A0ABD6BUG5_9EURY|nr:luciferase [Halolamina litorea]
MTPDTTHSDSTARRTTSESVGPFPRIGIDAVALKPTEVDLARAADLGASTLVIDYEGRESFPDAGTLRRLAETAAVRVTTPVRADGLDPLGDDSLAADLPAEVGRVLVAGHGAYLSEAETGRAIAPRFGEAIEQHPDAWVGTEGVERIALATGATQFELLSRSTERDVRALRAAGFDGEIAVYAPTVLAENEDDILDAVGAYVSRRGPVRRALPDDCATDSSATGRAREVLLAASTDFALVGDEETVAARVESLRGVGVDTVVGYPARGLDELFD